MRLPFDNLKPVEPLTDAEIKQTVVRLSNQLFGGGGRRRWVG